MTKIFIYNGSRIPYPECVCVFFFLLVNFMQCDTNHTKHSHNRGSALHTTTLLNLGKTVRIPVLSIMTQGLVSSRPLWQRWWLSTHTQQSSAAVLVFAKKKR